MKKLLITTVLISAFSQVAQADTSELTMEGEFGFIFATGNTETTSASAGLTLKQELEKWSNEFAFNGLYKQDQVTVGEGADAEDVDQTTAQKIFASGQGNYKLDNPDHRIFVFGSYEDDRFSNFKSQSTVAVGWNQKVWENETSSFDYSIGPGYSFAETQAGEDFDSAILRGAFNFTRTISETSKFTQTFSTEIGADNTKSRAESALTAQIAGALSMKLSIRLDHNSDVADDLENLDTETAVTLVYSFF